MTSVKELFSNQVHVGHASSKWNPRIKSYIFGKKNGVCLFDLEQTVKCLDEAKKFLATVKAANGKVLFVGTKPQAALEIRKQVVPAGCFHVSQKWIPGLLTNFKEIRKRIDHYLNLKSQFDTDEIRKYTKKEIAGFKKELDRLDVSFSGVAEMRKVPAVLVVLDAVVDRLSIEEANKIGIPVVAVVDVNATPDGVDYPIPGNDDALKSVRFLLQHLVESIK